MRRSDDILNDDVDCADAMRFDDCDPSGERILASYNLVQKRADGTASRQRRRRNVLAFEPLTRRQSFRWKEGGRSDDTQSLEGGTTPVLTT